MKKSKIISISILLYCFGVAFEYCFCHVMNILSVERTFLNSYFCLLFPQLIGIATAFILFMKNKKTESYILQAENVQYKCLNCGKDNYNNYFLFIKVFLAIELLGMFIPIDIFCIVEQSIASILFQIFIFLNELIPTFYLGKLVSFAALKSVSLFLVVYFFCEIYHFRKSDNCIKSIMESYK